MFDISFLQPEGVLPVAATGDIALQSMGFLDQPSLQLNFDTSLLGDEVTPPPRPRFNLDASLLGDEVTPPPLPK